MVEIRDLLDLREEMEMEYNRGLIGGAASSSSPFGLVLKRHIPALVVAELKRRDPDYIPNSYTQFMVGLAMISWASSGDWS
jgi:hypothetical protein